MQQTTIRSYCNIKKTIMKRFRLILFHLIVLLSFISCSENRSDTHAELKLSSFLTPDKSHSEAIRLCLNAARNYENKIIIFDVPKLLIDEAILLESNTTILLENCIIKQSNYTFDNVFRGNNLQLNKKDPYGYPLSVDSIKNICIRGIGECKIIGPDENMKIYHPIRNVHEPAIGDFYGWRTLQISFSFASNLEITGITFEKTRCWAISFDKCSYVRVHDLSIFSDVKNGDGVNFRSGCHHCEVYNLTGKTSDDTVACSALGSLELPIFPAGNYLYPMEPTSFLDSSGLCNLDIHDISLRDISTIGMHHGIILLTANGNQVYNVDIFNFIEPIGREERESVIKLYTGYGAISSADKIHDVNILNVVSRNANCVLQSNTKCAKITVSNLIQEKTSGKLLLLSDSDGFTIN